MSAEQIQKLINDFSVKFVGILYEALPFIILGAIISGFLEEFVPQRLISRFLPRRKIFSIMIGGLLGIIFPMCECGIVPVMRRLLRKGLPLSCCIAYLLAGPIINVVVMLSTYAAFTRPESQEKPPVVEELSPSLGILGGYSAAKQVPQPTQETSTPAPTSTPAGDSAIWMVCLRVGMAYLIAITTALIVDWQYEKHGNSLLTPGAIPPVATDDEEQAIERRPLWDRLSNVSHTTLNDFIDIMAFLIIGALLAATVRISLGEDQVEGLANSPAVVSILAMMALAVVLCLCSEADAFLAASFQQLPPAAKLSFLVLGPMMDIKLYFLYTRIFRPRLIWTIISAVVLQVLFYSLLVHWFWSSYQPFGVSASAS